MMDPAIGKWDQRLWETFRAAPEGPRRRALLNRLVIVNAPLAKTIIAQMCGIGDPKAAGRLA